MSGSLCGQCWKPLNDDATECGNCGFTVNPEKIIEDHRATLYKHQTTDLPPEYEWGGGRYAFFNILRDPENSTNMFFKSSNSPSSISIVLGFIIVSVLRLILDLFLFEVRSIDITVFIFTQFVLLFTLIYFMVWSLLIFGGYFVISAILAGLMGDNFPLGSPVKLNFSSKMRDYIGHLFFTPFLIILLVRTVIDYGAIGFDLTTGQTIELVFDLIYNIVWIVMGYLFFRGFRGKIGYVGRLPLILLGIILLFNLSGIYSTYLAYSVL